MSIYLYKSKVQILYQIGQGFNIGIKHDFLCINTARPQGRCFKFGFQHIPMGPADVTVSEKHV